MQRKLTLLGLGLLCAVAAPAAAQEKAPFYKGKTINILVGVSAGGEFDLLARLRARHIGKHIAGNPKVVVQNMTGAGGIVMANYLTNVAPKDGTYIGAITNGFQVYQAVDPKRIKFDTGKFRFIGTIAPTVETMTLWHTAGARSIEDARKIEIPIGAVGQGGITYSMPALLNELAGTKFKIVAGYRGGNNINLAMEKGEVLGRDNTWSSWKATRADWLRDKKLIVIAYGGPKPKDLPDVPNVLSFAKNQEDRQLVNLILSGAELGRPLVFAPGVPSDRLITLRAAHAATMKDPAFLEDAKKVRIDVDPVDPDHMEKVVREVLATPEKVRIRALKFVQK